ncbi:hypothetical protein AM493_13080 [Flavobacterium akiainvivens]|uniref:Uncharacterized protein n=1 Tax=Flavobacterium akiainvivens TaxID=1202724 RepID=A0A0N0RQW4_9FLAO|nr:hypothetical protein AM493_13080 [Flavobacterium akiainvivens]
MLTTIKLNAEFQKNKGLWHFYEKKTMLAEKISNPDFNILKLIVFATEYRNNGIYYTYNFYFFRYFNTSSI